MPLEIRSVALVPLLILVWCCRPCHLIPRSGVGSQDESRLVADLFDRSGYNYLVRPAKNQSQTITVQFGMAIVQLINVDEKNQIMKSNVWLRMIWEDYQMKWDPNDYGGIHTIRIEPDKVWRPEIVLFNNADGKYEVSYKSNVVISYDGSMLWIPPAIYKSSCTIDVEYFPFDQQECQMIFGSWTYTDDQVILNYYEGKDRVDLTDYVSSGTWDIIKCPGEKQLMYDDESKDRTSIITFTLSIRRKTLFYTVNLIIPCVLISFLSVCVFYLPADAGEKMTMCISILLALVVFMLLVSNLLPPTSITIPLIAKYLLFAFVMDIFTILITAIIINWNFRTPRTHRLPNWVRLVFLNYLPRILLMKRPDHEERWRIRKFNHPTSPLMSSQDSPSQFDTSDRSNLLQQHEQHHPNCKYYRKSGSTVFQNSFKQHSTTLFDYNIHMTPEMHKAVEAVRFTAAHLKNEDDYSEIIEDWRYIAMVIDRLMLYMFLGVTIGGTVGILINAPHIFEYVDQKKIIDYFTKLP